MPIFYSGMIVGRLSLRPKQSLKHSGNSQQAEHNFQGFIFRDTFTREKYPLRALSQAGGQRPLTSSLHETIRANRNNQLMSGFLAESNSRWTKLRKIDSAKHKPLEKEFKRIRSSESLAIEQNNLREYLKGKHKPKRVNKENVVPLSLFPLRQYRPATRQAKPSEDEEEERICTNVCELVKKEVRNRLTEEFSHLIKPDAFSVQYSNPLLQKFSSKRVEEFEKELQGKELSGSGLMERSQLLFNQESENIDGYIDEIEALKLKYMHELMPVQVTFEQQQFLIYAQKGDTFEVQYMLRRKPELVNSCCPKGNTALHNACKRGDKEMARLLVARSAGLHIKNKSGLMAVQLARHFDHPELVEMMEAAMARQELLLERCAAKIKQKQKAE